MLSKNNFFRFTAYYRHTFMIKCKSCKFNKVKTYFKASAISGNKRKRSPIKEHCWELLKRWVCNRCREWWQQLRIQMTGEWKLRPFVSYWKDVRPNKRQHFLHSHRLLYRIPLFIPFPSSNKLVGLLWLDLNLIHLRGGQKYPVEKLLFMNIPVTWLPVGTCKWDDRTSFVSFTHS